MANEQRKTLRYPVNQHGELVFPGRGRLRVKVIDIAVTGAGVLADLQFPVGVDGELHLLLVTPAMQRFVAPFTIAAVTLAGSSGYHLNLKFAPLPADMQEALLAYIRTRGKPAMVRPD